MKKRILCLLLCLAMLLPLIPIPAAAAASETNGNFQYWVTSGNTIVIEKYLGSSYNVRIPSEINGIPVTSVGDFAFEATDVRSVEFPSSVTRIGEYAFLNCAALKTVIFPRKLDADGIICECAFFGCTALDDVRLPYGLTEIENSAFDGCDALRMISVPSSVQTFGRNAVGKNGGATVIYAKNGTYAANYAEQNGIPRKLPFLYTTEERYPHGTVAFITEYVINDPDVIIPATIDGYTIYGIEEGAFEERDDLKSVMIADGVRAINSNAFYKCSGLKTIRLPSTLDYLGHSSFARCTGLTFVSIPGSISEHGLGTGIFENCTGLTEVTLGEGLTDVHHTMFWGCTNLKKVNLPSTMKEIGTYAFWECENLTDINLPDGLEAIHWYGFNGCKSLPDITIPSTVTQIGFASFENCDSFTHVRIPAGVQKIEGDAFLSCDNLREVIIEEGVREIEGYVFADCPNLYTVVIPSSVFRIYWTVFDNSPNVTVYGHTGSTAETIANENNFRFRPFVPPAEDETGKDFTYHVNSDGTVCIDKYMGSETVVTFPTVINGRTVTEIGPLVFDDVSYADVIGAVLPAKLKTIDSFAFDHCTGLQYLDIPPTVTSIGTYAFNVCSALTEIRVPNGVTSIGAGTFAHCPALESIVIPANVKSIAPGSIGKNTTIKTFDGTAAAEYAAENGNVWEYPFRFSWQSGHWTIVQYIGTDGDVTIPETHRGFPITTIGTLAFAECTALKKVTVPPYISSVELGAFKNCPNLREASLPDNLPTDGGRLFEGCISLEKVNIPAAYTELVPNMFRDCESLRHVEIPAGVTRIGDSVFYGCTNLQSVELPKGVTSLGVCCFASCDSLEEIILPDNMKYCGYQIFSGCKNLKRVDLGKPEKNILNMGMFQYCDSLTELTIPAGCRFVDEFMFADCPNLRTVYFEEEDLGRIYYNAFENCKSLTDIYYAGTEEQWNQIEFVDYGVGVRPDYTLREATIHFNYKPEDNDEIASGVNWYLDNDGCLHITGLVMNYSTMATDKTPWKEYKSLITSVVAEDYAAVNNGAWLFALCENLKSADLRELQTYPAENMCYMFGLCFALTDLKLSSNFRTLNAENMCGMFLLCSELTQIDVSVFDDTSRVTDMSGMFMGCSKLTSLDVSKFSTESLQNTDNMFSGCAALTEIGTNGGILAGTADQLIGISGSWTNKTTRKVYADADALRAIEGAVTLAAGASDEPERIPGDVNGDGTVDSKDVLFLKRAAAGLITLTDEQKAGADVNHDGTIDSKDVLLLKRAAAGLITLS